MTSTMTANLQNLTHTTLRLGEVHMSRTPWAAGAATGMLMLATALEAQAQPTCWHSYEIEAARVRDLHTLLMMRELKCGSAGVTMESQYNAFTNNKRPLQNGGWAGGVAG